MSTHSFKFLYKGVYYYPSVEVITQTTFKIHFYKSIQNYHLPQNFIVDTDSPDIIIGAFDKTQEGIDFLTVFKNELINHLKSIKAINQGLSK